LAAVALGVPIIEKHFTLDNTQIGMDNQMATEPDDFGKLITMSGHVRASLGSYNRVVSTDEYAQRANMRRSIVAARTMMPGDVINQEDILFKRPGTGISISDVDRVMGSTVIRRVEADHVIDPDDISYDN
jgi:sialic acid synthase SpsE